MNLSMHLTAAWRFDMPVGFTRCLRRLAPFVAALALLPWVPQARGADFNVTAPGLFYSFSTASGPIAGNNPTLTVVRGETYTFSVNTLGHPFRINSAGVSNNAASSGAVTWKVPLTASNYTYQCTAHPTLMIGSIITVPVHVAKISVGSNLVLRTTAPSNYSVFPEFKTSAAGSNWLALAVQTNRFLLGTNETICGLPPASNAFIRVKAVRR